MNIFKAKVDSFITSKGFRWEEGNEIEVSRDLLNGRIVPGRFVSNSYVHNK